MEKLEATNRSALAAGYGIVHTVVLKDKKLDAYAKLVYAYLSSRQGLGSKYCFPSINTISKDLGISATKTKESIKSLEENNWIQKKKRPHKNGNISNQYYVLFPAPQEVEEEQILQNKTGINQHKRPIAKQETLKILKAEGGSPHDLPEGEVGRDMTKGRSPHDQGLVATRLLTIPNNNNNEHTSSFAVSSIDKLKSKNNKLKFVLDYLGSKYSYHHGETIYIEAINDSEYEKILSKTKQYGYKIKRTSKQQRH